MFRSLSVVSFYTLLSRILGFVRDVIFAHIFGAGAATDAFFVAFKIPNFLRRLFAEGAFALAFVPILNEYKSQRSFDELKDFIDRVFGTLAVILAVVAFVGVVGAPGVITVFGPGFVSDDATFQLAVDMLRLTFPYILFISLTAFSAGILNTYNKFAVPAFTPVLLNVSFIACAFWLAPELERPIMALGWAVLIAGIAQFLFQLPFLKQLGLLPTPKPDRKCEGVKRITRLMIPALFGVSVTQINLLLDTVLASFLDRGSISWLYYSDRLMEFPVGLIGVALGTVILPSLSRHHTEENQAAFSQTIDWALRAVLFLAVPAAVALLILALPLVTTIFYSPVFQQHDALMSSYSLMAYSAGLLAFVAIKVLAPGFYARQDTKTPVKIAIKAMVANMVLNLILVFPLQHAGLALATSLSAILNASLLLWMLKKENILSFSDGWKLHFLRSFLATLAMGLVLHFVAAGDWFSISSMQRVAWLSGVIAAGAVVYFVVLFMMGFRVRHILR